MIRQTGKITTGSIPRIRIEILRCTRAVRQHRMVMDVTPIQSQSRPGRPNQNRITRRLQTQRFHLAAHPGNTRPYSTKYDDLLRRLNNRCIGASQRIRRMHRNFPGPVFDPIIIPIENRHHNPDILRNDELRCTCDHHACR